MNEPFITDSFAKLPEVLRNTGIPLHRCMLACDSNTVRLYGSEVAEKLKTVFDEVYIYTFEAGEQHKNLDSIEDFVAVLIEKHFDRKDVIAALGGGVTGDMGGFAAAVYLRGINVIQLPTTLLAQVDSSIGGKTGVDFRGFKNMIGAFHMPALVYTNTSVLSSLDEEQFSAGMGEVIKSALLADPYFYAWLRENRSGICARDRTLLLEMIRKTAGIKTAIVNRDPEEKGERALLNLGHTVGHAIEKYKSFAMLHGHCVGAGLCSAARISAERGLITEEEEEDIKNTLRLYGIPVSVSGLDENEILMITKSDKKMSAGRIRFILMDGIGRAFYADDVTDEELLDGIRALR